MHELLLYGFGLNRMNLWLSLPHPESSRQPFIAYSESSHLAEPRDISLYYSVYHHVWSMIRLAYKRGPRKHYYWVSSEEHPAAVFSSIMFK